MITSYPLRAVAGYRFRAGKLLAALLVAVLTIGSLRAATQEHGFAIVTSFSGVDKTGVTDSTAGIQTAINWARDRSLALYFPVGTYLISDTLIGDQLPKSPGAECSGHNYFAYNIVLIGESKGSARPVIKLANSASGFQSASSPKPMLHIRFMNGPDERTNCAFANGFRNINLDLGNNNPGAIGLRFGGAQECFLEDVHIEARDGYAGLLAWPGRGSGARNITIIGGKYGIDVDDNNEGGALGGHLVHVTFRNQTTAAIVNGTGRGFAAIGLDIEKSSGAAIITRYDGEQDGHMAIYDSRFKFTSGGGTVVDNKFGSDSRDVTVTMKNVYVTGASTLIENPTTGETVTLDDGVWSRVDLYTHGSDRMSGAAYNLVNGSQSALDIEAITGDSGAPPSSYRDMHFWAGPPDYAASGVVNAVTSSGGSVQPDDEVDDYSGLQNLINNHNVIFLPRGIYTLSQPLTLKANTVLFGTPGRKVVLDPTFNTANTWVLNTVDNASATTVLADVVFGNEPTNHWLTGAIHWRAGRNSVVAHTRDLVDTVGSATRYENDPVKVFQISGNGGGRWFGWTDHAFAAHTTAANSDLRKLLITGTTEPLTIYGPNPEHGGKSDNNDHTFFVEVNGSTNVRLFGVKLEGNGELILVKNSSNVFIGSAFVKPEPNNFELIRFDGGTRLEAQLISWPQSGSATGGQIVKELNHGSGDTVARDHMMVHYRRGNAVDWAAFSLGQSNQAPNASFSANPLSGTAPVTVTVDASGSSDPDGDSLTYSWNWGDGSTGSGVTASHTYSSAGDYTITLTVSDGKGGTDSAVNVVDVDAPGSGQTLVFNSTDDAYLQNGTRYDTTELRVENTSSRTRNSYLKFNVQGVTGAVSAATLELKNVDTSNRTGTWDMHLGSNSSWTETTLTNANAPSASSLLSSKTNLTAGEWMSFNVTNGVSGNGVVNFVFKMALNAGNDVKFSSDEGATPPKLSVTFAPTTTVQLASIADAYVNAAGASTNYGTNTKVATVGSSGYEKETLLKFSVSGITTTIRSAKLELVVTGIASGTPAGSTTVWRNNDTSWSETGVTWNTKPAKSTSLGMFANPTTLSQVVQFDVTSVVTGNGTYSFHLVNPDGVRIDYGSREDTGNEPMLIITHD